MRRAWLAFALAGVAAAVLYPLLGTSAQTVLFLAVQASAVVALAAGLRLHRPERPAPWLLLGAGALLLTAGDAVYAWLERSAAPVFPSLADVVYLVGYAPLAVALVLVVQRSGTSASAAFLDAGIWTGGALVAAWLPVLAPRADGSTAAVVAVAFPAVDAFLLLALVHLLLRRTATGLAQPALVAAFLALLLADTSYGVRSLSGTYRSGEATDLGWLAFSVLLGAAALHPSMRAVCGQALREDRPSQRRLLTLVVPALAAPALLVLLLLRGDLTGDRGGGLLVAAATAVLFLLSALRGRGLILALRAREAVLEAALRDRERLAEELRSRATSCALTGLVNRTGFVELVTEALATDEDLAVGLLDLDDFKGVNDTLGHDAGDRLLVEVAERLRGAVGPRDVVARLGGDEFALLLRGPVGPTADAVVASLEAPFLLEGHELSVEASLGVVSRTGRSAIGDLLRRADVAMYAAKAAGGNRWAPYEREMSVSLLRRLDLRSQLVRALERDEVQPWFQPVVDLSTGAVTGFEALARWCRPGRVVLPPGDWIGLAEETGLVVQIDRTVMRQAVREALRWGPGVDLAINVSGRTLQQPGCARAILELLAEEGLPTSSLVVEVTEGVLLDDEAVGRRLQTLRAAGVRIALDDFGTGWSSLAYLSRFPVDVLKIDRSFTAGLGTGAGGEAVASAVVQLARSLDLAVIAEGVETEDQAARLRDLGAKRAQGWLFGRPASAEVARGLVRPVGAALA